STSVFSELFAGRRQLLSRLNGRPAYGHFVSGNYFQVLGLNAALGRTLRPDDAQPPAGNAVVVLAFSLWQHEFAGDPTIVGQTVTINGHPVEGVGVVPEGFLGLDLLPHDFWAPLTLTRLLDPGTDLFAPTQPRQLEIIGRLKPGVGHLAATSALLRWS